MQDPKPDPLYTKRFHHVYENLDLVTVYTSLLLLFIPTWLKHHIKN